MTATIDEASVLAEVQNRDATLEHVDVDRGTMLVRAAPYEVEAQVGEELWETFGRGTFERATRDPQRVKLVNEHPGPVVGVGKVVEDRDDGSWVLFRFANTVAGQEARELAADKILDEVSVRFRPLPGHWKASRRGEHGIHVRHSRAHLLHVALVQHGAYGSDAFVASVRDAQTDRDAERQAAQEQLVKARREALARLERLNH